MNPSAPVHPELALGCRILWLEGHEHFFLGHVSARLPGDGYLLKASGLGLGETGPNDVIVVDSDGTTAQPELRHAEAPIHGEIFRARPDVGAVVHTHHWAVAALTASDANLEMVNQDSVYFWNRHGVFDSAAMITDSASGAALADCLGEHRAVLLRNHGLVTVGSSVREAVTLAVCLGRSAATQLRAASFGNVVPMAQGDLEALSATFEKSYDNRLSGLWTYLERMLDSPPAPL